MDRKSEVDIKYKGKEYNSFISRTPNDSLPRVVSQMGNTYVDNQIVLRLTRGNERVFSRTFTKKQFESLIGDDFMAKSILEGIVYDKTTPEGIVYAASICYPQTDLYVPISITISPDGSESLGVREINEWYSLPLYLISTSLLRAVMRCTPCASVLSCIKTRISLFFFSAEPEQAATAISIANPSR